MSPTDQRSSFWRRNWVRVKNGSGAIIPPFSVVLVSSVTVNNGELLFTVVQPNTSSTVFYWNGYLVTGPFAIGSASTAEGIASDLSEPGFVRYDSGTPAAQEGWGPKHGQLTLSKYYYGFEILGGNTTKFGNNVTVARWVGVNEILVKNGTGSDIAAGHTGDSYDVYIGPEGSEVDTTMNLTACNRSSQSFKNGKYGAAAHLGGAVYAVPFQT